MKTLPLAGALIASLAAFAAPASAQRDNKFTNLPGGWILMAGSESCTVGHLTSAVSTLFHSSRSDKPDGITIARADQADIAKGTIYPVIVKVAGSAPQETEARGNILGTDKGALLFTYPINSLISGDSILTVTIERPGGKMVHTVPVEGAKGAIEAVRACAKKGAQ